jgi:hypothetical protein
MVSGIGSLRFDKIAPAPLPSAQIIWRAPPRQPGKKAQKLHRVVLKAPGPRAKLPRPRFERVPIDWWRASQLSPFVNDETAARRRLAFEKAHFSPDPLNGGSPDANGQSRLVDAGAAPEKPPAAPQQGRLR